MATLVALIKLHAPLHIFSSCVDPSHDESEFGFVTSLSQESLVRMMQAAACEVLAQWSLSSWNVSSWNLATML